MTNHVLPSGDTFLAITMQHGGYWAKATDPITAIRDAYSNASRKETVIACYFGDNKSLSVDDFDGGLLYDLEKPPVPIGLFIVTRTSIKPLQKGHFNAAHESHIEWITRVQRETGDKVGEIFPPAQVA